jgi:hypothetical protein
MVTATKNTTRNDDFRLPRASDAERRIITSTQSKFNSFIRLINEKLHKDDKSSIRPDSTIGGISGTISPEDLKALRE